MVQRFWLIYVYLGVTCVCLTMRLSYSADENSQVVSITIVDKLPNSREAHANGKHTYNYATYPARIAVTDQGKGVVQQWDALNQKWMPLLVLDQSKGADYHYQSFRTYAQIDQLAPARKKPLTVPKEVVLELLKLSSQNKTPALQLEWNGFSTVTTPRIAPVERGQRWGIRSARKVWGLCAQTLRIAAETILKL